MVTLSLGGEAGNGAPSAGSVVGADAAHVDVVVGLVFEVGQRDGRCGGVDGGTVAVGEATRAVFKLEADVALAGSPADGGGVAGRYGIDCGGSIAGDTARPRGGCGGSPAFALPIITADGADAEVVIHVIHQSGDDVGAKSSGNLGTCAKVEALETVLNDPGLCHRVGIPVYLDAAGSGIASAESGDIGADGGGEDDGVAPFANDVVGGAA